MNRKTKWYAAAGLLLMALMIAGAACAQTVRGDLNERFAGVPSIEHEGTVYRLKARVDAVLLMGVDRRVQEKTAFRKGGQADFLLLLAIDDENKTVTPIEINRDTMTDVTVLSVLGQVNGTRYAQIALSHAFGDGGIRSCELTAQAVGGLLLDTPIDEYLSMSMDGIAQLNDLLGGVEVTLQDDFTAYDPAMRAGTTLTLRGMQAEYYIRERYFVGDQSNTSRLSRQRDYLQRVKGLLMNRLRQSGRFASELFEALEPYMVTNMSRGKLINMANKAAQYEVKPIVELAGEARIGDDGFMQFYPDAGALKETVIGAFYK